MTPVDAAQRILDTMLGHLGFAATIETHENHEDPEEPCLQILTSQSEFLIGRDGHRLDDLQYLVNRVLRRHLPDAPRIKVDCEHYRTINEDKLIEEVRGLADRVRASGKPFHLRPLNAYYRRIVHNVLMDDPEVESHSPEGSQRLKRITLRKRGQRGKPRE
jgi:spoIIIJ-associated protein